MTEVARVYPLKRQQPESQFSEPQIPERQIPERQIPEPQIPEPQIPEPLWREVLGRRLRELRAEREETLKETADRAGISPQYLSEIERGRKEPSSEMIAALAGALETTLIDLTTAIAEDIRQARAFQARAFQPERVARLDRATPLTRNALASRPGSAPNALAFAA